MNEKVNYVLVRDNNGLVHIGRRLPSNPHDENSLHYLISQCGHFKSEPNEQGDYLTMDNEPTCQKCIEKNNRIMELRENKENG